ncbi:MAG: tetratricopeptide repeat protein [Planctomycetaceae bacterium]|nr:tetratricopeptide repeat protein [Planctomycetaceae bacterium]
MSDPNYNDDGFAAPSQPGSDDDVPEAVALFSRAVLLVSTNRLALAEAVLLEVLALEPDFAFAHAYLSICVVKDPRRSAEALSEAQLGVHLSPDEPFMHFALAHVHYAGGRIDEALESIETAIALNPDDGEYFGYRALCHLSKQNWDQALESAMIGLRLKPDDERCWAARLAALESTARLDEIAPVATEALRLNPNSVPAHVSLGTAMLHQGDFRAAQKSLAEALRLAPHLHPARRAMIRALHMENSAYRWNHLMITQIARWAEQHQRRQLSLWRQTSFLFFPVLLLIHWILTPVFNLWLRVHPFGRFLLTNSEKRAVNLLVTVWLGAGLLTIISSLVNRQWWPLALGAVMGLGLTIVLSVPNHCSVYWIRVVGHLIACVFVALFVMVHWALFFGLIRYDLLAAYFVGLLFYWLLAQPMMATRGK